MVIDGVMLLADTALRAELKVGAFPPAAYDGADYEDSRYILCTSAFCTSQPAITVHVRGLDNEPTTLGMDAIFDIVNTQDAPYLRLEGKQSTS